jgi:hypothetical protein
MKNDSSPVDPQKDSADTPALNQTLRGPAGSGDNGSQKEEPIVHKISVNSGSSPDDMTMKNVAIVFILIIVAGIASGYAFSYMNKSRGAYQNAGDSAALSNGGDVAESAGIADKETFKDKAEGKLSEKEEDDPEEGSFKLVRPGGESQTVFLTSSTVDLSVFIGKDVRVYGETFASDKVGWLMDVGFIEIKK